MCNACHQSCRFCTGPYVVQCKDRCKRYAVLQPDNTCKCKEGYYLDEPSGDCLMCFSTCKTCNGPGQSGCEQLNPCVPPAFLQGQECRCATGLYMDAYSGSCNQCDPQCRECYDTGPLACRSCADSNAALTEKKKGSISEWSCQCKEPYKMNSRNACFKCNAGAFSKGDDCTNCMRGCASCRSEGECDICDKDFYMNKSKQCVSTVNSRNCSTRYLQSQLFVQLAKKPTKAENSLQMKDIFEQYLVTIEPLDGSHKPGLFELRPIKSQVDWEVAELRVAIKVIGRTARDSSPSSSSRRETTSMPSEYCRPQRQRICSVLSLISPPTGSSRRKRNRTSECGSTASTEYLLSLCCS
jgi:hypothetical protein